MRHLSIVCRLGVLDTAPVTTRLGSHVTTISFVDGKRRLCFGLGQALDQLHALGLRPPERAVDLALVAAAVTAADTRISREMEAQDAWTREIDLYIPVADPVLWSAQAELLRLALNFLTGDRWTVHFRARPATLPTLMASTQRPRTANPTCVWLVSRGLDSLHRIRDRSSEARRGFLAGGATTAGRYQE